MYVFCIYICIAPIEVGYEFTQYVTSEGQGAVDLSIIIFDPYTGRAPRPFTLSVSTEHGTASIHIIYLYAEIHNFFTHTVAPGDYGAVANQIITFAEGQMRATHTIIINQDDDCEYDPNENFFSNISLNSDKQPISVIRPRAEVIIDDTNEPECRKCQTHTIMSYTCYSCIVHAHITKYIQ